jgi:hypothetical protein
MKCITRALVAGITLVASAHAQTGPLVLAQPTKDDGAVPERLALLPLQLSLGAGLFMNGDRTVSQCQSAPSLSVGGFPAQHTFSLASPIPRLTLHAFATVGCPTDSYVGTGVVYTKPLWKGVWLVASAGALILPTTTTAQPATGMLRPGVVGDVRVDLVLKSPGSLGPAFTAGVGVRGVQFGGMF